MKTIYYIIISLISLNCYSQTSSLYILLDNKSTVDTLIVKNDSIYYQEFKIIYNKDILKYMDFKLTKEMKLEKTIHLSGKNIDTTFNLIYKNSKNNNPPKIVLNKNVINILTYNDLTKARNFKNLISIIKLYENIYLINEELKYDEYYIAKKVSIKPSLSDL